MSAQILAIDPGASGGFAWRMWSGEILSLPMAKLQSPQSIVYWLRTNVDLNTRVVLEAQTGGFQVQAGHKAAFSGQFKFGRGVGVLEGAIRCIGAHLDEVYPQTWMKALGVGNRKDHPTKAAWKMHLADMARKRFPGKITLATSDAMLILAYAIDTYR